MDVLGALLLVIVMYIIIPVAVCVAALVLLGGAERLIPGGAKRSASSRDAYNQADHR